MRSFSKSRILALLLVLGAPFVAPASLTTPAFAQEEVLSEELQQILQGDPLEVRLRLQVLVDSNPGQASLILDRALEQASDAAWTEVSSVARSHALRQAQQNLNFGLDPLVPGLYQPVGGQFLMWQNNLPYALGVRTEQELQAAFIITQLQLGNQYQLPLGLMYNWLGNSLQFESCIAGVSIKVGPYGSITGNVSRGC